MNATNPRARHRSDAAARIGTRTREPLVTELDRYVQDELVARATGMWL